MDATADQEHEFNGEAEEGTGPASADGPEELAVELVDVTDGEEGLAVTRSEEPVLTRSSDGAAPSASTRSRSGDHLDDGETAAGVLADNMLSDDARYGRWQARRPLVGHLKAGVVFPPGSSVAVPLFDVGDRIVVEKRATDLGPQQPDPLDPEAGPKWPWFQTVVGRVLSIDDDTGEVVINDEGRCQQQGYSVWRTRACFTSDPGVQAFYLAPAHGDPFDASAVLAARREEQRRLAQAAASLPGAPAKRGRGRPPGSKNRPKDVIAAEREAYQKGLEERRNRRKAMRAGL